MPTWKALRQFYLQNHAPDDAQYECAHQHEHQRNGRRLTGILILTTERRNLVQNLRRDTKEFFNHKTFEVLMTVKDEESLVNFYIKRKVTSVYLRWLWSWMKGMSLY
jgi:hypothetical protein